MYMYWWVIPRAGRWTCGFPEGRRSLCTRTCRWRRWCAAGTGCAVGTPCAGWGFWVSGKVVRRVSAVLSVCRFSFHRLMAVHAIFLKSIGFVFSVMFSFCKYTIWISLCQALHRNPVDYQAIYICKSGICMSFLIFRWNSGEGCKGRKFTLKRWYRRSLKEANLFGWKTVCVRWRSGEYSPENTHVSFLSGVRHGKARKADVGISDNRSQ